MSLLTAILIAAVALIAITRVKPFSNFAAWLANAPAALLGAGFVISLLARAAGTPALDARLLALGADALLSILIFVAAIQFRLSTLAKNCPASFRLTVGGAPVFLGLCGLSAFVLVPQLGLGAAFVLAGALMLNGAAFDRRAVANARTPSLIKTAVRFESAAVLALGAPAFIALEALATTAPMGQPAATPIFDAARGMLIGFAIGGASGLLAAIVGKKLRTPRSQIAIACFSALLAALLSSIFGGNILMTAAAAGLIWSEESPCRGLPRLRLRRSAELGIIPVTYFAFGLIMGPRLLEADLLIVVFALAAATLMRAVPRLASLHHSSYPREAQGFLAWFGGAPGAASALCLISLLDTAGLVGLDAILTVGTPSVFFGVIAARLSSKPLLDSYLKESARARKRAMLA